MSTETTSRSRRPYDVRGTVIYAGGHEHDVAVGEVYQNGQPHPEEIAKIWASSDRIMFPALAKIRNAASAAANGQFYQTVEDLRDLLSSIAIVAANALPVPTIGDTKDGAPPAQSFAAGTAAILGRLDVNGESRFGTFIEMTPDECRGVAIGDLLGRRVSLVPTEDLAQAVLPAAPDHTSATDLNELAKRLAFAAYRVGFPSASTDDLERMWTSLTAEGRAPWIAAAKEVPAAMPDAPASEGIVYPEQLTPALREALGVPNFQASPIAHALRADGADIARRSEDEQAHVLHWFVGLVLRHGDRWKEVVGDELQRIADAAKTRTSAGGGQ